MAHAETCPICLGKGVIPTKDSTIAGNVIPGSWEMCHGCGGQGWVEVKDEPVDTLSWFNPDLSEIQHLLSNKPIRW